MDSSSSSHQAQPQAAVGPQCLPRPGVPGRAPWSLPPPFSLQEIVTALSCGKNIVPIIDGFEWPEPQALPEDMQAVLTFNGIK